MVVKKVDRDKWILSKKKKRINIKKCTSKQLYSKSIYEKYDSCTHHTRFKNVSSNWQTTTPNPHKDHHLIPWWIQHISSRWSLFFQLTTCSTGSLDVPMSVSQGMKAKFISDFSSVHGVGQILLVGKNQQEGIAKLVFVQHALKLITSLWNTVAIVGINNKDDTLSVLEI